MPTLVFLEHHGGEIQKGALGVLAKAASLGDAHGVIAGSGVAGLAGKAHGAGKVWVADDPALEAPLPQPRVDVLEQVVKDGGYDTVLFAASVLAADVAAGLAARLDAGLNWDLVDLQERDGTLVGTRPALGDSVYVEVGWKSDPRLGADPLRHLRARRRRRRASPKSRRSRSSSRTSRRRRRCSSRRTRSRAALRSRTPTSSSPAAAVSAARRTSRWSRSSRRRSAARSPRRARSSTRAGTRTRPRSARRASPSRRSSTLPAGSPVQSSTRWACRART